MSQLESVKCINKLSCQKVKQTLNKLQFQTSVSISLCFTVRHYRELSHENETSILFQRFQEKMLIARLLYHLEINKHRSGG